MELNVVSFAEGTQAGSMPVEDSVFGVEFNEPLVHQAVTAYLAGARSGSKRNKSRAQVAGGGAKPWRQKGLGRARVGSSRNPIWRGGGVTFAAAPRSFKQKVNRKMYRGALRSMLSELIRTERLLAVDAIEVDAPKTKLLVTALQRNNLDSALLVSDQPDDKLFLAARNLPHIDVCAVEEMNPVELTRFANVVMTRAALEILQRRLA